MRFGLLFLLVACKAQLGPNPNGQTDASPTRDGHPPPIDTPSGMGQDAMLGAWATPQTIPGADLGNTANVLDDPTVASNKLELIYSMQLSGAANSNFYVMTRATDTDAWGTPALISELSSATSEISPRLSPDDLTLYFSRGGLIYTATRTAIGAMWTNIAPLTAVNATGATQRWMSVCNGGYFVLSRNVTGSGTSNDFYDGQLGNGAGTIDGTLNTQYSDVGAQLSPDCTRMYFASTRPAGTSASIFVATRATVNDPWGAAMPATDFNDPNATQDDPWISNDQRLFVFTRASTGVPNALYYSTR